MVVFIKGYPLAFPTPEAHDNDDNKANNYPASWYSFYWLRTFKGDQYSIEKNSVVFGGEPGNLVFISGVAGWSSEFSGRSMGVRPALYIQSDVQFSGDGSKNNPYKFTVSGTAPVASSEDVGIYIDGQKQVFADQPVIVQGRTLLPMRALFQALGADVAWDGDTGTAIGSRDGIEVRIPIGSTNPTVNGKPTPIQVPAQLINSRTYIPLRFVGEALGDDVQWDGRTRSVIITKK